ncbi:MAG: helix-turn-helix transcriptional regulator, partial [Candidatus Dormibacteraceae bacterium]
MVVNRFPPNYKLREARAQRGWTQEAVVEALYETAEAEGYPELKIDSSMISRWECGKQQPQAYHAFLLAKIYGKSVDQMGFVARSRARAGISFLHSSEHSVKVEGVKRRNLMLGMGSMAAPLPDVSSLYPEHWDRLSRVLKNPKGIDETTVTSLESETAVFQRLNLTISSIQLLPHLTSHLDRLSDVLTGTIEPKLRRRLVMTMGEAVELAGWLAWEQGDSVASRRLYQVVAAASHEADYPPLLACCLADMSYASSSRGDASRAEYLISQAMKKL